MSLRQRFHDWLESKWFSYFLVGMLRCTEEPTKHPINEKERLRLATKAPVFMIAQELQSFLFFRGLTYYFEIISHPDQTPGLVCVWRLDPSGEALYKGTNRKGVLIFKIEVERPDLFTFCLLDHSLDLLDEPVKWYRNEESLIHAACRRLEDIVLARCAK